MSLEQLKLTKQILNAAADLGISKSFEIQEKSISRIMGGQDLIIVGPEGVGKTTTMVMAVINKLKYGQEEPPRALILVPNKEKVISLIETFEAFGKKSGLKIAGLYPGLSLESQKDTLAEGADIVIGTPERTHDIYLKSGLNVNKLKMLILDDAELIVQQGFKTLVIQLCESLPKCQRVIFSEVFHSKLEQMATSILNFPTLIEVEAHVGTAMDTIGLQLYKVPNYKTKLNLLNMLMADAYQFPKIIIYANTRITAESLYKSLNKRIMGEVALWNPKSTADLGFWSIEEFENTHEVRVLVVANEDSQINFLNTPYLLHFDLPESKELFIERIKRNDEDQRVMAITFSTDLELTQVAKIELAIGKKMPVEDLPPGLIVEGDRQSHKNDQKNEPQTEEERGSAFHQKKASNMKDYNLKYKDRLKMFGKKNRKNKRGE